MRNSFFILTAYCVYKEPEHSNSLISWGRVLSYAEEKNQTIFQAVKNFWVIFDSQKGLEEFLIHQPKEFQIQNVWDCQFGLTTIFLVFPEDKTGSPAGFSQSCLQPSRTSLS